MSVSLSNNTSWITLMEYATKKGVSLSTLRRHIKSKRIVHRIENGRYLLPDSPDLEGASDISEEISNIALRTELQKARIEIAELKMLIALYEEGVPPQRMDV